MIQNICGGAAVAFVVFALFSTGVLSKLAWAAVFATFTVTFITDGGRDYGWAGASGAIAVCKAADAVNTWAKGRRARKAAVDA